MIRTTMIRVNLRSLVWQDGLRALSLGAKYEWYIDDDAQPDRHHIQAVTNRDTHPKAKMKTLQSLIVLSIAVGAGLASAQNPDWHRAFPGFQIAGNLYYVGTADLAVYLIKTSKGNILINSDFPQDVPLIRKSIHQLGFEYGDTRIILISHAHDDHAAAVGQIQRETGARVMVMEPDAAWVQSTEPDHPGAQVDRLLHDGDIVELGEAKLTARLTAGHTPGCTTWTMQVREGERKLNAVIIGSPNVNPGYVLVGNTNYPQIAQDYERGFAVLNSLPVDLFLGAHGSYFNLKGKYKMMKAGGQNPFIDPARYRAYVTERRDAFRKEWDRQKQHPGSPAP